MPKVPTPKPVIVEQHCSICELDWDLHSENPTIEECVELLKKHGVVKYLPRPYVQPTITFCCYHSGTYYSCSCSCHNNYYPQWGWTTTSNTMIVTSSSEPPELPQIAIA